MQCNCDKDSNGTLTCPIHSGNWVEPQKTGDSEPASKEELEQYQQMFLAEDITGGFQNVEIPEDYDPEVREELDVDTVDRLILAEPDDNAPQRGDIIRVDMTPEQLAFTIEAMKRVSWKESDLEYFYNDDSNCSQYDDIAKIRKLVDSLDLQFKWYKENRPYSPFIKAWLKRTFL